MKCLWRLMIWSGILFTAQNIYRCGKKGNVPHYCRQERFLFIKLVAGSFLLENVSSITTIHIQLTLKLFVVRQIFQRASQR